MPCSDAKFFYSKSFKSKVNTAQGVEKGATNIDKRKEVVKPFFIDK